jgi:hypothetical protein
MPLAPLAAALALDEQRLDADGLDWALVDMVTFQLVHITGAHLLHDLHQPRDQLGRLGLGVAAWQLAQLLEVFAASGAQYEAAALAIVESAFRGSDSRYRIVPARAPQLMH